MAGTAVEIREYANYWAQEGAVLSLIYQTPDPLDCKDDKRAYAIVVHPEGISGFGLAGAGSVPASYAPTMKGGHRRITDNVWEAFVVLSQPVRLGAVLQPTVRPCDTKGSYELRNVLLWRDSGNIVQNGLAKVEDYAENANEKGFAEWAGGGAVDAGKKLVSSAFDIVSPLIIPLIAGVILYEIGKDALEGK